MLVQARHPVPVAHRPRGSRTARVGLALADSTVRLTEADPAAFEETEGTGSLYGGLPWVRVDPYATVDGMPKGARAKAARTWGLAKSDRDGRAWLADGLAGRFRHVRAATVFFRTPVMPGLDADGATAGADLDDEAVRGAPDGWREAGATRLQAYLDGNVRIAGNEVWLRWPGRTHWLDESVAAYRCTTWAVEMPATPLQAVVDPEGMRAAIDPNLQHWVGEGRIPRYAGAIPLAAHTPMTASEDPAWYAASALARAANCAPAAILRLASRSGLQPGDGFDEGMRARLRGLRSAAVSGRLGPDPALDPETLLVGCAATIRDLVDGAESRPPRGPTERGHRALARLHLAAIEGVLLPRLRHGRPSPPEDERALSGLAF